MWVVLLSIYPSVYLFVRHPSPSPYIHELAFRFHDRLRGCTSTPHTESSPLACPWLAEPATRRRGRGQTKKASVGLRCPSCIKSTWGRCAHVLKLPTKRGRSDSGLCGASHEAMQPLKIYQPALLRKFPYLWLTLLTSLKRTPRDSGPSSARSGRSSNPGW